MIMKKNILIMLIFCFGNVVFANEIPKEEEHLDESISALEKGSVLDLQLKQATWVLEQDQRKRKIITKLVHKEIEKGSPIAQIGSLLYMLRSFTPECRRFDEWESKHGNLFYHAEPVKQIRVACENTPECQAYDNWIHIEALQSIIDETDSEEKKKKLKEEQRY